jgi:DNA-binding HxlR family transcriptional regulator
VRIDYGLTEQGKDLAGVIDELAAWAERWSRETVG